MNEIGNYYRLLSSDKRRVFSIVTAQVAIGLFELLSIYAMYALATRLSGLNQTSFADVFKENTLLLNGAIVAALYLSKPGFYYVANYWVFKKIFASWKDVTLKISRNYFERRKELGNKNNMTEQWDGILISELPTSYTSFVIPFSNALAESFVAFILIAFMLSINWQSTGLAVLTVMVVFAIVNLLTRSRISRLGNTRSEQEVLRVKNLKEILLSKDELIYFDQGRQVFNHLSKNLDGISNSWANHLALAQVPKTAMELSAIVAALSSVLYMVLIQKLQFSEVFSFGITTGFIVLRLVPAANKIILGLQYAKFTKPTIVQVLKYLATDGKENKICRIDDGENLIRFEGYEFANGTKKDIIISGNGFYAIKADSGYGKSVFLKSILGVVKPKYLKRFVAVRGGSKGISYLPQEPRLWFGTLSENLFDTYLGSHEKEEALHLFEVIGLSEWFEKLPDGFDTMITDDFDQISGGQKARIAFVRALLKKPSVLLLDEFTANLDDDTKSTILDICSSLSETKLIIAASHDLKTIKTATNVLELK